MARLPDLIALAASAAVVAGVPAAVGAKGSATVRFDLRGVVTAVPDGNTIEITLTTRARQRVRVLGIAAPTQGSCYASEARSESRRLALRKRVRLVGDRTQPRRDRLGRLLVYVELPGGADLGRRLLEGGFADVAVQGRPFSRLNTYRAAQRRAQSDGRGLWSACREAVPPTPSPSPPGAVVFDGAWEAAEPVRGQWSGAQCENWGVADENPVGTDRGVLTVVTDIVAEGAKAARFDLNAGSKTTACEALKSRLLGTGQGYPAVEEWYALQFRTSSPISATPWGTSIAQLKFQGHWGSPVGLTVDKRGRSVRLFVEAGECSPPQNGGRGCRYHNGDGPGATRPPAYAIPRTRFAPQVWHQLLVRVRWAVDNDGIIQVWHRKRGKSAWKQTVDIGGQPTVQWKPGGFAHPQQGVVDKIGAYRGASQSPLSVWHDSFCVATTRGAAESCL